MTIGIFAIISVFTLVDSLERSIRDSLSLLDANNLDIRKFPYEFGPDFKWWEYMKRPNNTYDEYKFLQENLRNAEGITIFAATAGFNGPIPQVVKYKNNSISVAGIYGIAHTHIDVYDFAGDIEKGRFFTLLEAETGKNITLIGYQVARQLFGKQSALGKEIKIKGLKYVVIGVLEEEGQGIFGDSGNDEAVFIPYKSFEKIYYVGRTRGIESAISVKGSPKDIGLVELEAEITGLLRTKRGLKPKEKNNFSVNRQEAFLNIIGSVFDVIGVAGWAIGGFSILVGGFGIANIMFVSVRERTSVIGLQKSLGAKNYFVLFQFLFEAVFLSLIGGAFGILLVWLLSFISLGNLNLVLTFGNVVLGLGVAGTIGVISGIVPALLAARMDPVIAIRTNG